MRVWPWLISLCKSCPFRHSTDPSKLENSIHVSPTIATSTQASTKREPIDVNRKLRSSLRRTTGSEPRPKYKSRIKKVQWLDALGKDLAVVKEIKAVKEDDEDQMRRVCICTIL
uniref:Uncharacterized protein n=1 Tax=Kalanchoe fedtschenkoi TaxID=63787 RepID=A0A7N0TJN8_KALFE